MEAVKEVNSAQGFSLAQIAVAAFLGTIFASLLLTCINVGRRYGVWPAAAAGIAVIALHVGLALFVPVAPQIASTLFFAAQLVAMLFVNYVLRIDGDGSGLWLRCIVLSLGCGAARLAILFLLLRG